MKIAVLSDLQLYRKPDRLLCALRAAAGTDALLLAGDLADRAQREQYELLLHHLRQELGSLPVYCVSGNHDNPARNDTEYRAFEAAIMPGNAARHENGAFYALLAPQTDLLGLNPAYHQKQFFFPEKGSQLAFAEERLAASPAQVHLLLCHPPLIAHNPQRTAAMQPYLTAEQDRRLQNLMDAHRRCILLSGHTHCAPTVEWDAQRCNLYLNCGSICPTDLPGAGVQQGNITLLELTEGQIRVQIAGIHTGKLFAEQTFEIGKP